eukprot:732030-Rhodomonas_salina.1
MEESVCWHAGQCGGAWWMRASGGEGDPGRRGRAAAGSRSPLPAAASTLSATRPVTFCPKPLCASGRSLCSADAIREGCVRLCYC